MSALDRSSSTITKAIRRGIAPETVFSFARGLENLVDLRACTQDSQRPNVRVARCQYRCGLRARTSSAKAMKAGKHHDARDFFRMAGISLSLYRSRAARNGSWRSSIGSGNASSRFATMLSLTGRTTAKHSLQLAVPESGTRVPCRIGSTYPLPTRCPSFLPKDYQNHHSLGL
jgi:hypothetical protein